MNAMSEVPVIVCAADDNYVMPLTVMLRSLIDNTRKYGHVIVYVLHDSIPEPRRKLLEESLDPSRISVTWIAVDNEQLKDLKTAFYHTVTLYYRVLIPRLLPESVRKAIVLDADIVVLGDIGMLWDTNVENACVAAVPDMYPGSLYVSSPLGIRRYRELNIPETNKYFNAGVVVLNLEKWRKDGVTDAIIRYLRYYKKYVVWADQDGMNAVLYDQWQELDPRWNVAQYIFEYTSWKKSPFSPEVFNQLTASPFIIHFIGFRKPWHSDCTHVKKQIFLNYLKLTVWNDRIAPRIRGASSIGKLKRFVQRMRFACYITKMGAMHRLDRFIRLMTPSEAAGKACGKSNDRGAC